MKKVTILLLSIALLAGLSSFVLQKNSSTQGAKIEFTKTTFNFGTIPHSPKKSKDGKCKFQFKNTGDEPLILKGVKSSCGCTTPQYTEEPILPGETGVITVQYDNSRPGYFSKHITISTNGEPKTVVLTIKGNVVKQASGEPVNPTSTVPNAN